MKARAASLAAGLALLCAASAGAQSNPTMSDDFTRMMGWLTQQTADGLAFNAGSSFDPPTEMRSWRLQPDVSLGLGVLPYDKKAFPKMQVQALADTHPEAALPDSVMFPNLTIHMRLGLPGRSDLGFRFADMTTPSNYKLSPQTTGNGQSNTLGVALRHHFFGGDLPLLSVAAVYNHTFGYFNFKNELRNVELTPGFTADSTNKGMMEWDVRSFGFNLVASQAYGKWIPFGGVGYNRMIGSVTGKLEADWKTPLISPSIGSAKSDPYPDNARIILGFQREGSFFRFFMNSEIKAMGPMAGKSFIISSGLAAPFRIGASSQLVRYGRNRPEGLASVLTPERIADPVPPAPPARRRSTALPDARPVSTRVSYRGWDKIETPPPAKQTAQGTQPELIFIR